MKKLSLFVAIIMLLSLAGCALRPFDLQSFTDARDEQTVTEPKTTSPDKSEGESLGTSDDQAHGSDQSDEPEVTPIYDTSAILQAYRSGNTSALSEKDQAIYSAALNAISNFYTAGMSQEDIVIAAHDWITTHTTYDETMLLPIPVQSPDTENPYGALIKGQAICMGYTTTFQLFMDMLGVESMIVRGSSEDDEGVEEEHAWNLVRLDGEWYHVDVTWDDFVPDEPDRQAFHSFVLVPDYMMEVAHIWDHSSAPSATAEDRIYLKTHGKCVSSKEEGDALLTEAFKNGQDYEEIMYDSFSRDSFGEVSRESIGMQYCYQYWLNDYGKYIVVIYWML